MSQPEAIRPRVFKSLGPVLRDLRLDRGLTQGELAEITGVGTSTLSAYETGRTTPTIEKLDLLLVGLGVGSEEFGRLLAAEAPGGRARRRGRPPRGVVLGGVLPAATFAEQVVALTDLFRRLADLLEAALQAPPGPAGGAAEEPPSAGEQEADDGGDR